MKKLLLLSALLIFSSLSAQDVGFGLHYQTQSKDETYKSVLIFNLDYKPNNGKIIYGLEFGVNLSGVGDDTNYTDVINLGQYPEDITGEYTSNLVKVGGRFGYDLSDKITIIGTLGLNFLTEYQLRFDDLYILGDNGSYAIASGESPTDSYVKASVMFNLGKLKPEIGIGSNGFSVGANYFL